MEKMTIAKRNEILRQRAFDKLFKEGILGIDLLQVAGSKFMTDIEFEGEVYPVRIDIVVPKIDKDDTCQFAQDFADEYAQDLEEKKIAKENISKIRQQYATLTKQHGVTINPIIRYQANVEGKDYTNFGFQYIKIHIF